jgi:hypothetical protein
VAARFRIRGGHRPQSSSASGGAAGFFILSQSRVHPPDTYGAEALDDASKTSLQAWLATSLASAELTMGEKLL